MAKDTPRPITLLIAAMGGEGGGVLTSWIVSAARKAGHPVQATSSPFVISEVTPGEMHLLEVSRAGFQTFDAISTSNNAIHSWGVFTR